MTLNELRHCHANHLPVAVHAPEHPAHIRARQIGYIDDISETEDQELLKTARFSVALVWVMFTDGMRNVFGADEIRPARLRGEPPVVKAAFIHTASKTYGADDRRAATNKR